MLRMSQVVVEGQTISYATEGSGPTVVMLHGMLFDQRVWAQTIPYLVGHTRVVAPNLTIESQSPETLVRLVGGFMTNTQSVPAVVIGSGIGGALALAVAARYPERVRAVVAIGSAGGEIWPEARLFRVARALRHIPGVLSTVVRLFRRTTASRILNAMHSDTPHADAGVRLAELLGDAQSRKHMLYAWRSLAKWGELKRLYGGVRSPTLLIWGEHDHIYGLKSAERLRHQIPGAQLVTIERAGHLLPVERPVELASIIRRYISPALRPAPPHPASR